MPLVLRLYLSQVAFWERETCGWGCKTESHYSWDLLWPDFPQLSAACPVNAPVFCKCHAVSTFGQVSLRTSLEEHGLPSSQSHHVNLPLLLFFILDDFDSLKIMEPSELPHFPFHLVLGCLLWGKEMHHFNVKRVHGYSLLKRVTHYKRLKTAAAIYCIFIIYVFSLMLFSESKFKVNISFCFYTFKLRKSLEQQFLKTVGWEQNKKFSFQPFHFLLFCHFYLNLSTKLFLRK